MRNSKTVYAAGILAVSLWGAAGVPASEEPAAPEYGQESSAVQQADTTGGVTAEPAVVAQAETAEAPAPVRSKSMQDSAEESLGKGAPEPASSDRYIALGILLALAVFAFTRKSFRPAAPTASPAVSPTPEAASPEPVEEAATVEESGETSEAGESGATDAAETVPEQAESPAGESDQEEPAATESESAKAGESEHGEEHTA
jgi:hypothetical protein